MELFPDASISVSNTNPVYKDRAVKFLSGYKVNCRACLPHVVLYQVLCPQRSWWGQSCKHCRPVSWYTSFRFNCCWEEEQSWQRSG